MDSVFKLLFWNIFDPGTVEKFGCRTDPALPRYVAMTLFAHYLVLTVIILLNTLIAIMNNSVNSISQREVRSLKLVSTIGIGYINQCKQALQSSCELLRQRKELNRQPTSRGTRGRTTGVTLRMFQGIFSCHMNPGSVGKSQEWSEAEAV